MICFIITIYDWYGIDEKGNLEVKHVLAFNGPAMPLEFAVGVIDLLYSDDLCKAIILWAI